jgi:hypothetical protein
MDRSDRRDSGEASPAGNAGRDRDAGTHATDQDLDQNVANPPRTKTGHMTAPKFGSATSGGGEIEPGPERD